MKDKLIKLLDYAIAPKGQSVSSSIVIMKDGEFFTGVSIKNDIYRDSISSEAAAISAAVTKGYKKDMFARLYIMTSSDDLNDLKYYNREIIYEFFEIEATVHLLNKKGKEKVIPVADLYKEVL